MEIIVSSTATCLIETLQISLPSVYRTQLRTLRTLTYTHSSAQICPILVPGLKMGHFLRALKGIRSILKPGRILLHDKSVFLLLCIASSMQMNGCSRDEGYFPLPEIDYYLVVTDSIGVELGEDEYMFAWATDPTYSPDGSILVVDRLKHAVFVYSAECVYLTTIGREGEGPGEFRMPSTVEFFPDGGLLISDSDGISIFDSSYAYIDQLVWDSFSPWIREALDDGAVIGNLTQFVPSDEGVEFENVLGRWDHGEEEASVVYCSIMTEWDLSSPGTIDDTDDRDAALNYCASRDGRVFYSRSAIDDFVIHCCDPDGSEFLLIEEDIPHRVGKTYAEMEQEMNSKRSWFNAMGSRTGRSVDDFEIILDPYRRTIMGMFVDGEDRLWVRLGIHQGIVFRVYDMDGDVLFHAMVDYPGDQLDLDSWEINGDEYGFLAVNNSMEYCQKVYMLELVEAE
ncbi:MAG: hypothetical protein JXA64_05760 [Candidatus Fermentibacteraceae bacterium]|nr:hypothetical protein [Candidatus Fermentibacteraceae bacterium]MBN2608602.1 hypothetical protein [Candidatus Fermentibacteraceae bacterium]